MNFSFTFCAAITVILLINFGTKYAVGPDESAERPFGWVLLSINSRNSFRVSDFAELSWVRRKSLMDHPITGLKPFVQK